MAFLLGILIGVFCSPPTPEAVRAALNEVLAGHRFQTELPDADRATQGSPPRGSSDASDPDRQPRGRSGRTYEPREPAERGERDSSEGAGWAEALAVALMAVVGVLAVLWVSRAVAGRRRAVRAPSPAVTPVAPVLHDVPLGEIDALAAAGRYDEAVHVLLLRSIAAVGRTVKALPVSLTSREVLARAPLPDGAAAELAGIVDAVETSWFGGRPVGREGFEACRERFRRFAGLCGAAPA